MMARSLRNIQTLVYYDGPQLSVATDPVGTRYLCLWVEQSETQDRFFCVAVSDARLAEFRQGALDLLEIYRNPEMDELFIGDFELVGDEVALAVESVEQPPEHWYPQEELFLTPDEAEDTTTVEAKDKNKAVVHLALNPPEAREEPQIDVRHLVNGLRIYQNLVKHAYNKAVRAVDKNIREQDQLSSASNYQMEVFVFSQGSFTVNMQSKRPADMLGFSTIERALDFVDRAVSASSSDLEQTIAFFRQNRGHFLSAYRELLRFIKDNDSPLRYEWSAPQYTTARRNTISVEAATELYELLTTQQSWTAEIVDLTGIVERADTVNNTWRLLSENDGRRYSGKVAPGSPKKLSGIVLDTERYRFHCEERLQEVASTGEETTELLLLDYERLSPPTLSEAELPVSSE